MSETSAMDQFEQLARINQLLLDANLKNVQAKTTPVQIAIAAAASTAALLGAVFAILKVWWG